MDSVDRILDRRDKIRARLNSFIARELVGEEFERFLYELSRGLPKYVPALAIRKSAEPLKGQKPETDSLKDFAWRLAANLRRLRAGEAVLPWTFQPEPESVVAQILDCRPYLNKDRKPVAEYTLRLLTGRPCPMTVAHIWSKKFLRFAAVPAFGFTPPWGDRPFHDLTELVRMRFVARIEPAFSSNGRPGFDRFGSSTACLKWNRQVFLLRDHDAKPCPESFTHPCHECPIGYDRCKAATHPRTYVWRRCLQCGQEDCHEPDPDARTCVHCSRNAVRSYR